MNAQITTTKRLLTRYGNKLEQLIEEYKGKKLESLRAELDEEAQKVNKENLRQLEEAMGAIDTLVGQLEATLSRFLTLRDSSYTPGTEPDDNETYSIRAEDGIATAVEYMTLLQSRIRAIKSCDGMSQPQGTAPQLSTGTQAQVRKPQSVELPTLPIPKFKGNIWDWDNFWELYDANVHSQDLPELYKFNYLLDALQGEAKESIQKFHVTKENYSKAITFLQNRYGSGEELIQKLINKLENSQLRSQSLKDQRSLFERIQVIIHQLKQKGEQVDSQWMMKKILSKFPEEIQRKVLMRKRSVPSYLQSQSMQGLFDLMEDVLSGEEMVQIHLEKPAKTTAPEMNEPHQRRGLRKNRILPCMYCKGDHKPAECGKFKTPQERAQYLRERNLCQLCASAHHVTADCRRQPCFHCQGPHHTSCCFKAAVNSTTSPSCVSGNNSHQRRESNSQRTERKGEKIQTRTATRVNLLADGMTSQVRNEAEEQRTHSEGAILSIQPSRNDGSRSRKTYLPIGEVSVVDPKAMNLRKIQVLVDTGAEMSFIETGLANELSLPTTEEKLLSYYTFGSEDVQKKKSRRVQLPTWDNDGKLHMLNLLTSDIFMKDFAVPPLSGEDEEALRSLNLQPPLEMVTNRQAKPSILLGSDQAWQFFRENCSQIQLPSGLHVLPTTMGNILAGQLKAQQKILHLRLNDDSEEFTQWDKYWSFRPQVNMVHEDVWADGMDDEHRWEKYWELESAGTHEFGNPEKEEKDRQDKEVWDNFNLTIERRSDGYYVKLPWKDDHPQLPDNHAIAMRRLHSVWNSLQKDQNLLQRYDAVFQEQIQMNILEDIPEDKPSSKSKIHYLAHQAVVTPNKSTTKLRIVFDASAHYKGSPSLNEVLHRGPVILPQLFGILLRFRIGKIGIISDVEKAFLQVRLHESERDSTRCLWLWNYKRPPQPDNIRSLRFTRVAFGLTASPFLLAATTHYHLDTYSSERDLVREVKNNLYVDNVLLTAESRQEAHHKYIKCKEMFNDLSMNLREFVSNDEKLMQVMDDKDRSADLQPKVLGIRWNSLNDQFQVKCSITTDTHISKRTVARAVASIYDPLGWLIPLTHRAKRFLQSLWKEGYGWDSTLSPCHAQQWFKIVNEITGFEKIIPRVVGTSSRDQVIVTFADASSESMAACIYLHNSASTHLLMARERLPSLKNAMTMPKMELNAVTLAMRLTETVVKELRSAMDIKYIYIFSDSEIVLSWVKNHPIAEKSVMISNRLKEIDNIVEHLQSLEYEVYFGHVDSLQNPADCATRGLRKDEFAFHFWWEGPIFLKEIESKEKNAMFKIKSEKEHEEQNILLAAEAQSSVNKADRYLVTPKQATTLTQAKRIIAYVLRFIRAIIRQLRIKQSSQVELASWWTTPLESYSSTLTGEEVMEAGKVIIRHHQRTEITPEIIKKLAHLRVRKDKEGILRCHGRLGTSALETSAKYPIFILQKSFLAKLIINEHHQGAHPGVNHTMSLLRQTFWIPQLRSQVIKQVRACIKCQRLNNLPFTYPEQSDLPPERVRQSRPFEHIGLDYFGPLQVSTITGERSKCYGCIITCLVTRLIHLDIVADSSTVSFLNMLRRFFGRRGIPASITCDNAPTFLLGEEILREQTDAAQVDPAIARVLSNNEIKWKHITPYAPWQGGVYERLIKSVKSTLNKTLGRAIPSFEELTTIIVEIEAFLNTRPLLYSDASMDPESMLRPIDFLQNHMQVYFPFEAEQEEAGDNSYASSDEIPSLKTKQQTIKALQSSVNLTERAWKIWQTQYLTALRERHQVNLKTTKGGVNIPRKGNLVLIHDETQPRHSWKMGRIEELCPNAQGIIREAVVRIPSRRRIRRPINLLIPLELEGTTTNEMEYHENSSSIEGTSSRSSSHYNLRRRHTPTTASISTIIMISFMCCLFASSGLIAETSYTSNIKYKQNISYRCHSNKGNIKYLSQVFLHKNYPHGKFIDSHWQVRESTPSLSCFCSHGFSRKLKQSASSQSFKFNVLFKFNLSTNEYATSCALDFRLDPRDVEGGPKYLSRMILELRPTSQRLEGDLTAVLNELKIQVKETTSLRNEWFRLLCSTTLHEMGAAERLQLLNRHLLTASLTKERLLRLGTRYVLTDRIYESNAQVDKELAARRDEWLQIEDVQVSTKDVMALIERDVRRLGTTIKEITEYMVTAEKELKSNRRELEAADVLKKSVQAMQDQLQALRMVPNKPDESVNAAQPKKPDKSVKESQLHKPQPSQESDDQYFDRLLRESSGDQVEEAKKVEDKEKEHGKESSKYVPPEKPGSSKTCSGRKRALTEEEPTAAVADQPSSSGINAKKSKPATSQRAADGTADIRREIEIMEATLSKYPHRMIVEYSKDIDRKIDCSFCGAKGAHYSDSCPHVVDGFQRMQVAIYCGRCFKCMKFCHGTCKAKEKGCWYCNPLRGTPFEDVIPPYQHHRAVCPAPDMKEELRLRLHQKIEELTNLERERTSLRRWECRECDLVYSLVCLSFMFVLCSFILIIQPFSL